MRWLVLLFAFACGDDSSTVDAGSDANEPDAPVDVGVGTDGQVDGSLDGSLDGSSDAGSDGALDAESADASSDATDCEPEECCYRTVEMRPGLFHTVTEESPQLVVSPLEAGEGFFCMRVRYTMMVPDNLAEIDEAYEGCPIYSHAATIEGGSAVGRVMSTAYFRFLRIGCAPRRPGAVELNALGMSNTATNAGWAPGTTYEITQTIEPFESRVSLRRDGVQVGPEVIVDITGGTVDDTRDTRVAFGLDRVYENAFFPYFGATYSDLLIEADVAAAP